MPKKHRTEEEKAKDRQRRLKTEQEISKLLAGTEKDKYDPIRYADKDLLRNFADQMMKTLYPGKELAHLPEDIEEKKKKFLDYEVRNNPADTARREEVLRKIAEEEAEDDPAQVNAVNNPVQEEPAKEPAPEAPEKAYDPEQALLEILNEIGEYSDIDMTSNRKKDILGSLYSYFTEAEGNIASLIYKQLKILNDYLQSHPAPENAPQGYDRKSMVYGLLQYFDSEINGNLERDHTMLESSDDVHINYTGFYMKHEKLEDIVIYDNDYEGDNIVERNATDLPLFPHTPSAQDVQQGKLGDCYFVSTLASLADTHPEKIRDMMHDNGNGTVTVRFFYKDEHDTTLPCYVTVDKVRNVMQASGSLWVQVLERALAASGIMNSFMMNEILDGRDKAMGKVPPKRNARPVPANMNKILSMYSQNNYPAVIKEYLPREEYPWIYDNNGNLRPWVPELEMINSGNSSAIFPLILGEDVNVNEIIMHPENTDPSPQKDEELEDIDLNEGYTAEEIDRFNAIEKACKDKQTAVTAGAFRPKDGSGDSVVIRGIYKRHSYTVLDTEKINVKGKERLFIKLRNPHGESGRTYITDGDKLRAVVNTNVEGNKNARDNGFCYVELKHFMKEFYFYSVAEMKDSKVIQNTRISTEEKRMMEAYQSALSSVRKYLESADRTFTKDSDWYDDLKTYLWDMTDNFPKTYAELSSRMGQLKEYINGYEQHAERRKKDAGNFRRNAKLKACAAMKNLISESEKGRFRRPMAVMENKIADQAVNEFINSTNTLAKDPEKYTSMQKLAKADPVQAKKNLLKSEQFQRWSAGHSYMTLFNVLQSGVRLNEIAPPNALFNNKVERAMMNISQLRKLKKRELGKEKFAQLVAMKAEENKKKKEEAENKPKIEKKKISSQAEVAFH